MTDCLEQDLITVPVACRQYLGGTSPETIYRLIRRNEFDPAVHIGRKVFISVPKLRRYLHGEVS